jgi:hypothetical protein
VLRYFSGSSISFKLTCILLIAATIGISACDVEGTIEEQSRTPLAAVTPTSKTSTARTSEADAAGQASTNTPDPSIDITADLPEASKTALPPNSTPAASMTIPVDTPMPGLIGPDDYGINVNPLTGLAVNDPQTLARRPIAIKISNSARVRPQAGLNSADIVFEHLTEGGITRFTAIYYGRDSHKVGSIRSGRLIDLEIPIMYDAAFSYSGSSAPLRLMFLNSLFFDRIISPDFAHGGFERISDPAKPDERVEDTLYTDTYVLRWMLEQRGQEVSPVFRSGMAFHPDPPGQGTAVRGVEIAYPATGVYWYYSQSTGDYLRWSDGIWHLDPNSEKQLAFQNIVVLKATHLATDIIEDSGGSPSLQIQLWGEGPVSLYRNGQRYDGIWRRLDSRDMLTFYTEDGGILPLSPGKTFFQVVPLDFSEVYDTP